jgi:uncharacterized membrane protein YdfJ with MMPL/SSD domain
MSAAASRGLLTMATRQLMSRWEETRQSWRDNKAADFEALYLSEVRDTVSAAIRTLEELDQLLQKVHADCE